MQPGPTYVNISDDNGVPIAVQDVLPLGIAVNDQGPPRSAFGSVANTLSISHNTGRKTTMDDWTALH